MRRRSSGGYGALPGATTTSPAHSPATASGLLRYRRNRTRRVPVALLAYRHNKTIAPARQSHANPRTLAALCAAIVTLAPGTRVTQGHLPPHSTRVPAMAASFGCTPYKPAPTSYKHSNYSNNSHGIHHVPDTQAHGSPQPTNGFDFPKPLPSPPPLGRPVRALQHCTATLKMAMLGKNFPQVVHRQTGYGSHSRPAPSCSARDPRSSTECFRITTTKPAHSGRSALDIHTAAAAGHPRNCNHNNTCTVSPKTEAARLVNTHLHGRIFLHAYGSLNTAAALPAPCDRSSFGRGCQRQPVQL